jgi:hypothetical protein
LERVDKKGSMAALGTCSTQRTPAPPSKSHNPEMDYNLETRAMAAAAPATLNLEPLAERGSLLKNAQYLSKVKTSRSAVMPPNFEIFFLWA